MANTSPTELYMAIPPLTRVWLTAAVVATVGARFRAFQPQLLVFDPALVVGKFQAWRLLTNFAYFGPPSFNWVIQMLMLYRYSAALEDNPYPSGGGTHRGNLADYVFMLLLGGTLLLAAAVALGVLTMASSLSFMVVYVWSKRNPTTEVTMFMFRMPGGYLPFALIAWAIAIGEDPVMDLIGLLAGHVFYFLVDALPNSTGAGGGVRWLRTPGFLYTALGLPPTYAPAAYVAGAARAARDAGGAPPRAGGHAWPAGGHQLGGR